MRIGFDYDGTLTNEKLIYLYNLILDDNDKHTQAYIITSREKNYENIKITKKPIRQSARYYSPEVYFGDKAKNINNLGIELFFEDNPIEAKLIEQQCPNCKVVLVDLSSIKLETTPNGIIYNEDCNGK